MLQNTPSKTNIFCFSDLQAERYRREAVRAIQQGQWVRTDTWADFRIQILCPGIFKGPKQRAQV